MERPEPVMRVQAIYHRNDPIILASPPNVPPDEQSFYRAFMQEHAFDDLDGPVARLGAPYAPVPVSPPLENAYLVTSRTIAREARSLIAP